MLPPLVTDKAVSVLREKGTLRELVLVPLMFLAFFMCSICELMLKYTVNGTTIPSHRGCCQLQSISVMVQCTTSVNVNSSRKTRKVDLSVGEGSKESRSHGKVSVRRLQVMISQKFSQALAVECSFFAAVLTNLLWPWSLGDVTIGVQQKHRHDTRKCLIQNLAGPLPFFFAELFLSQIRWGRWQV